MKAKVVSIRLNKEFKRAYYKGRFKAHPFLVTYAVKTRFNTRFGITTPKKIGSAVCRNRARRIIKAAYCMLLAEGKLPCKGYDFVFVAREGINGRKMQEIKAIIEKQVKFVTSPSVSPQNSPQEKNRGKQ